jgi:uncharacterized membrane protein (DUF485 family)
MDEITMKKIRADVDFQTLTRTRSILSWSLTAAMLILYFGFILMVAFAPGALTMMGAPASILSFVIPIALILAPVVLISIYVWRANTRFDGLTAQITAKIKDEFQ